MMCNSYRFCGVCEPDKHELFDVVGDHIVVDGRAVVRAEVPAVGRFAAAVAEAPAVVLAAG